jgi:hypothetical protein
MPKHILHTLLGAALFGLLASGCFSCDRKDSADRDAGFEILSADTLSLFEGRRLYDEGRYELAREQLMKSAGSTSIYIRTESFLYLNAIEMDLGNWDAARPWLERYHAEAVKLFRQTADVQRRITIHTEQTERSIVSLRWIMAGIVCALALLAVLAIRERRRRISAAQNRAERTGQSAAPPDPAVWRRHLANAEMFMRTQIYAEIAGLALQTPDRSAKVLSHARQEVLDAELTETFAAFTAELRADYPSLTAGDVKLCCLSLSGLSSFGRALCFGSTETNIVKQRKHKIKQKLTADEGGRRLFDFIFTPRGV